LLLLLLLLLPLLLTLRGDSRAISNESARVASQIRLQIRWIRKRTLAALAGPLTAHDGIYEYRESRKSAGFGVFQQVDVVAILQAAACV